MTLNIYFKKGLIMNKYEKYTLIQRLLFLLGISTVLWQSLFGPFFGIIGLLVLIFYFVFWYYSCKERKKLPEDYTTSKKFEYLDLFITIIGLIIIIYKFVNKLY